MPRFENPKDLFTRMPTGEELGDSAVEMATAPALADSAKFKEGMEGLRKGDTSGLSDWATGNAMNAGLSTMGGGLSTKVIPRQALDKIIAGATEDGVVNQSKLLQGMEIKPGLEEMYNNVAKTGDLLGHTALTKTGFPETQSQDALRALYPESKHATVRTLDPEEIKKFEGLYKRPVISTQNGKRLADNPMDAEIGVNPNSLEKFPTNATGTLLHEAEHLRDTVLNPLKQNPEMTVSRKSLLEDPIRIKQVLQDNPKVIDELYNYYKATRGGNFSREEFENLLNTKNLHKLFSDKGTIDSVYKSGNLSPEDILKLSTGRHFRSYPNNFETQKSIELLNDGIKIPDQESMLSKMKDMESDYYSKLQQIDDYKRGQAALPKPKRFTGLKD